MYVEKPVLYINRFKTEHHLEFASKSESGWLFDEFKMETIKLVTVGDFFGGDGTGIRNYKTALCQVLAQSHGLKDDTIAMSFDNYQSITRSLIFWAPLALALIVEKVSAARARAR